MNGHNISPKAIKFKKGTTQKSNILTRECGAQQPLAGQNIQHLKYEAGLLPQKLFSNSKEIIIFFKYCYTAKEIIILISPWFTCIQTDKNLKKQWYHCGGGC